MRTWLRDKLDAITQEFLDGAGTAPVFEAQYLAYLECLEVLERGLVKAPKVWAEWHEVCAKATPPGERPQCLSYRIHDRKEIAAALQSFRGQFDKVIRKPSYKVSLSTKLEPASQDLIDLWDLLSGDTE